LAGGVAHDFNNLLAVILNYTSFIGEEVTKAAEAPGGDGWTQVASDVQQVQRAAERATQLTHQLLAFGRREVVRPEVLNLNSGVSSVGQLVRRSIGEHVQLTTRLASDLGRIVADPGQVEQVLLNLAVNARDAMPDGGTLTIDTENLVVDVDQADVRPGDYVRLRVSDTGVGMDGDVAARAFEPFFTTKPKGEGSGLGLATVYGIVTQAGGHAQLRSEPGVGTTFTGLFPATDQPLQPSTPTTAALHAQGGETVLLVEDEDAIREVTRRILARHGYEVLVAAGGADAVRIAEERRDPIDVLRTDVVMPEMLGKEVAERVRAVQPGVRVLFMSGYAQPVLTSSGTLSEGVVLVEKPFNEGGLLAKLKEVLEADP
jgi:CheY-like chemotaxis protein